MDDFNYLQHISGDVERRQAVHHLMDAYGKDVWNFTYSLVRNADAADDITQDTFIKVFEKLETFAGQSNVKTWILSIARNRAYDVRRSAFWKKVTLVSELFEERGSPSPSAEQVVLDQTAANEIWAQVLRLPIKYREVLVLSIHHHLTHVEIASLLQIAEGTVKSRLYRARLKMLESLKGGESYAK